MLDQPQSYSGGAPQRAEYAPDEISLYDLWDVLAKRWSTLFGTAAAVFAMGLAYALLKPVTYEFRSGIDIGQVYRPAQEEGGDQQLVESPDAAQARLQDELIIRVRRGLFDTENSGPGVTIQPRLNQGALVLTSVVPEASVETVERLHRAIADALEADHQQRFQRGKLVALEQYRPVEETLAAQLRLLEEQLAGVAGMQAAIGTGDALVAMVASQRMADLRRETAETRVELARVRGNIASIDEGSSPTRLSFLASQSETPAGAGKSLIVALSLVLGGMLGMFAAFFAEFVSNARHRPHRPALKGI